MSKSTDLYKKAKKIIPGGTQLLSKRPEFFLPDLWPAYYSKAKGCEVWDLDGNKYIDMSYMGVGSCVIGYADDDIDQAVIDAILKGNMSTLNVPEEVELAELLCELHPWANSVRYARTGGEAVSVAIRIARAKTGKDKILFSGYHGWHDWYLAANLSDEKALDGVHLAGLEPNGVPKALAGTSFPFFYNDTEGFLKLIDKHKNGVAAVIIEAIRNKEPEKEFIDTIRQKTKEFGVVSIIDEVSSAWRLNVGGAHLIYNIKPDIAVFAKGMSNGFPMAAIIGKKDIMDAAQTSFISSTYWTDKIGPTAAIVTIKKLKKYNIPQHLITTGKKVKKGWEEIADKYSLKINIGGIDPIGHFSLKYENPLVLKTLFTQLMLDRGFLATNAFYASYAHKKEHVEKYLNAVDECFAFIEKTLKQGNPDKYLKGPVCHSGFERLT